MADTLQVKDVVGQDPVSLVLDGDGLSAQQDAGQRVRTKLGGTVEVVDDLVEVQANNEDDMEEAYGGEDGVEAGGGPLVDPSVSVSNRHPDQTEAVG